MRSRTDNSSSSSFSTSSQGELRCIWFTKGEAGKELKDRLRGQTHFVLRFPLFGPKSNLVVFDQLMKYVPFLEKEVNKQEILTEFADQLCKTTISLPSHVSKKLKDKKDRCNKNEAWYYDITKELPTECPAASKNVQFMFFLFKKIKETASASYELAPRGGALVSCSKTVRTKRKPKDEEKEGRSAKISRTTSRSLKGNLPNPSHLADELPHAVAPVTPKKIVLKRTGKVLSPFKTTTSLNLSTVSAESAAPVISPGASTIPMFSHPVTLTPMQTLSTASTSTVNSEERQLSYAAHRFLSPVTKQALEKVIVVKISKQP